MPVTLKQNGTNFFNTPTLLFSGAELECPIEISPKEVVLQYQGTTQSVECKSKTNETNVKEIFWTRKGYKISSRHWAADPDRDWDPQLVCHGEFIGMGDCSKALHYTLYSKCVQLTPHPTTGSTNHRNDENTSVSRPRNFVWK